MKSTIFLSLLFCPFYLNAEFVIYNGTGIQYTPAISFDGSNFFVIWSDGRSYLSAIYGTRLTQSGTVLDTNGLWLLQENDDQSQPGVAYDGTNYLVVWQFGC